MDEINSSINEQNKTISQLTDTSRDILTLLKELNENDKVTNNTVLQLSKDLLDSEAIIKEKLENCENNITNTIQYKTNFLSGEIHKEATDTIISINDNSILYNIYSFYDYLCEPQHHSTSLMFIFSMTFLSGILANKYL